MSLILQTDADPFQIVDEVINSPLLTIGVRVVAVFFVVLWLSLVYWTVADAGRRGAVRMFWGLVAVVLPFVGTLVYLIVRPPEYLLDYKERELEVAILERELSRNTLCPSCRSTVEKEYILCPECGLNLKKPCESCQKPLHLNWDICPYCTAEQGEKKINW